MSRAQASTLLKVPSVNLQTAPSFGVDNDGSDDGDASDASSRLKAHLPNLPPPLFE